VNVQLFFFLICLAGPVASFSFGEAQGLDPVTIGLVKSSHASDDDVDDDRFAPIAKPVPPAPKPKVVKKIERPPASVDQPKVEVAKAPEPPPAPAVVPPKPSIGDQFKFLILGGSDNDIEDFKKQISPLDRRNNKLEIELAPAYFYNDSSSTFSPRRFSVSGPGLDANANVWLSPFFGLRVGYFSSFNSTVGSSGTKQNVSADYQNTEFGVRFRKHFGVYRKAPSITWGLDYFQDSMKVPGETSDRVSTSSSGLSLSMQADLPQTNFYSHILGVEIRPKLVHTETSLSDLKSGTGNDSNALGAWVGGNFLFDRRNQVFWKLQGTVEQNTFEGQGPVVDPKTGIAPNGVTVTNTMTMFTLGYRWGN
jgi:hypothetical protein